MTDSLVRDLRLAYLFFKNGRFNLKHNAENCSTTNFTTYFNATTVLSDNVLGDPQSQPRTFLAG